jgi:hypothetical protein
MKIKRLRSVCHSIAHHAVSGLSYVHPHLLATIRSSGLDHLTIDLLDSEPCPEPFRSLEPLLLSLRGLKNKFETILASEGMAPSELSVASLTFTHDPACKDDHCSVCHAVLAPLGGRGVEYAVNYMGESLAPNNAMHATREDARA